MNEKFRSVMTVFPDSHLRNRVELHSLKCTIDGAGVEVTKLNYHCRDSGVHWRLLCRVYTFLDLPGSGLGHSTGRPCDTPVLSERNAWDQGFPPAAALSLGV